VQTKNVSVHWRGRHRFSNRDELFGQQLGTSIEFIRGSVQ